MFQIKQTMKIFFRWGEKWDVLLLEDLNLEMGNVISI